MSVATNTGPTNNATPAASSRPTTDVDPDLEGADEAWSWKLNRTLKRDIFFNVRYLGGQAGVCNWSLRRALAHRIRPDERAQFVRVDEDPDGGEPPVAREQSDRHPPPDCSLIDAGIERRCFDGDVA